MILISERALFRINKKKEEFIMKKMLSKLVNKVSTAYGVATSNASIVLLLGQTKAPSCLIKKD